MGPKETRYLTGAMQSQVLDPQILFWCMSCTFILTSVSQRGYILNLMDYLWVYSLQIMKQETNKTKFSQKLLHWDQRLSDCDPSSKTWKQFCTFEDEATILFDFGSVTSTMHKGAWEESYPPVPWAIDIQTSVTLINTEVLLLFECKWIKFFFFLFLKNNYGINDLINECHVCHTMILDVQIIPEVLSHGFHDFHLFSTVFV